MYIEDIKEDSSWLMKGDCLERMKEIPDGSVDLILTDPPYGTTACKWDSVIPLEPMWEQLKRIINAGEYINAGRSIDAGESIKAGEFIEAGESIEAGIVAGLSTT